MLNLSPKYIIATPGYNGESGGIMSLHQLCHLLNEISEAYVFPMPRGTVVNHLNLANIDYIIQQEKSFAQNFRISPDLNTPVFKGEISLDRSVVIYPEIVFGNPFKFKNIARWILYHSGFHRKAICTSFGEVEFKFNQNYSSSVIHNFSELSDITLFILIPKKTEYEALKNNVNCKPEEILTSKTETAFCVRKGKFRPHPLITDQSICIDGKKTQEIREIMKQVKYFISFDPYTYYSTMASVYGCYSLIIAPDDQSETEILEWNKRSEEEPWLAFYENQLENSWRNRRKLLEYFDNSLQQSRNNVKKFHNFWTNRINSNIKK